MKLAQNGLDEHSVAWEKIFIKAISLKCPVVVQFVLFDFGVLTLYFFVVSENKVLCHPSSIDSLSTAAGTEDHVSMGGYSARKAVKVVENVERGTAK
jgi:hypothetical protein